MRVDDLQRLLIEKRMDMTSRDTFYESEVLPSDYMYYKRVNIHAHKDCCETRRDLTVTYLAEEENIALLLGDSLKKPSFEWGETFCTFVGNHLRVYTNNDFEVAIETQNLINSSLNKLQERFNLDRIWIAQFHNGGHFYPTGKSIHKFSMFYETVTIGTSSVKDYFQNIPVSLFSKSTNHLLENDVIEIADFKDENIATYGLKYVADEYGCKSGYLFAIKSIDNKFVGVLGIDYTKKRKVLTNDEISDIRVEVTSIGGVIMNHLQNIH
jgi:hypothetical protein